LTHADSGWPWLVRPDVIEEVELYALKGQEYQGVLNRKSYVLSRFMDPLGGRIRLSVSAEGHKRTSEKKRLSHSGAKCKNSRAKMRPMCSYRLQVEVAVDGNRRVKRSNGIAGSAARLGTMHYALKC
jgi:hypothetical protein